jgi:hypothetical protein
VGLEMGGLGANKVCQISSLILETWVKTKRYIGKRLGNNFLNIRTLIISKIDRNEK